ncbi:WecB/TagA/CpsF family glycosyltransferase [Actinomycetospora sp. NBC_00405]|uniref:WecB/TagA/CpsF family glycosyltransferase n=1 Tax=Actinomycetospora sp. NBC_00405 TaxID=2975952 RepID=UPI002E224B5E
MAVADTAALDTVPSPRAVPHIEMVETGHQHHLLGVNLRLYSSVQSAADELIQEARNSSVAVSVFTCNVDHMMLMRRDEDLRDAYSRADVVTIDGAPLALLSRWTGASNAPRVTGVDLTSALIAEAAASDLRVALIGGAPGRGEEAARRLKLAHPNLGNVLTDSPQMGFGLGDEEDARLIRRLKAFAPHIVVVCLGAPKQELWIDMHRRELPGAVMVGAGATIDFLSGAQARAPKLFQRTGTEAVFRLLTDFRRLWRRYLLRDLRFLCTATVVITTYALWSFRVLQHTPAHTGRGCCCDLATR